APRDPELAPYQERWKETFERVNHPEVSAAYPPLVQAVNAAVVSLAGGPVPPERARLALRVCFTACDLGVTLVLLALLRRRGSPMAQAAVWAWSPLVALEFAGSGHLDALGILFLVLALSFAAGELARDRVQEESRSPRWAIVWLVAGAATKLLPGALLPFALRRSKHLVSDLGLV